MKTRNPILMVIFMFTAMILTMVSVQGNSRNVVKHDLAYSMNSPPGEVIIVSIETPTFQVVQTPVSDIQIARGVSVPIKFLISDAIIYDDFQSYECNIYYTISRTDYKSDALDGYPNQIDKYPFASDLGNRERLQA
jgi:hypothetical protein